MRVLLTLFVMSLFFSCDSSSYKPKPKDPNDYGDGTETLNHQELAHKFIDEISADTDTEWTFIKSLTKRYNFMVALNPTTGELEAIDIGDYDPEALSALDHYQRANVLSGLEYVPGYWTTDYYDVVVGTDDFGRPIYETKKDTNYYSAYYRHEDTGLRFEKTQATPKDLAKMAGIKEAYQIKKSAEFLSSQFGLSLTRSQEVARLTANWKKASRKAMTMAEIDHFSEELLGFSMTKGIEALDRSFEGQSSDLESLIQTAAEHNSVTPEHMQKIIEKVIK